MKTLFAFLLSFIACVPAYARDFSFHYSNDRYSVGYSQSDYRYRDPYIHYPRYSPEYIQRVEYNRRYQERIYIDVRNYPPQDNIRRIAYRNPYLPVCIGFDRNEGVYYEYYC